MILKEIGNVEKKCHVHMRLVLVQKQRICFRVAVDHLLRRRKVVCWTVKREFERPRNEE